MSYVLGLTGSVGMGKSTTAQMFRDLGYPVWDADAAVHRLYAAGGAAVAPIADAFPSAIQNGVVDRGALKAILAQNPAALSQLEQIVHPLVALDRKAFVDAATGPLVVLDIPLLYEIGADALCDGVAVVSVPSEVQRQRVLDRGTMTPADLDLILSRQMPDADKRARADWVIPTLTMDGARAAVNDIVQQVMHA